MREVDLSKQRREGIRHTVMGSLIGIVAVILVSSGLGPKGEIGWVSGLGFLVGIFALSFLSSGVGILVRGVPGELPGHVVRRLCPYCHHEVQDGDLPTPGLNAVCPKCGRIFGRSQW